MRAVTTEQLTFPDDPSTPVLDPSAPACTGNHRVYVAARFLAPRAKNPADIHVEPWAPICHACAKTWWLPAPAGVGRTYVGPLIKLREAAYPRNPLDALGKQIADMAQRLGAE